MGYVMASRLHLPGCSVSVSEGWRDVTETLEMDSPPPTLAKEHGVGALQFSIALYRDGPVPNATVGDLQELLSGFAASRNLGDGFDRRETTSKQLMTAASFHSEGDLLRVWYVSDGENIGFITYVCAWESRHIEVAECDAIVNSLRFELRQ